MSKAVKPNYKTVGTDKYFFSAYLNMARHNAYIILSHITQRLMEKPTTDEEQLANMYAVQILINKHKPGEAIKAVDLLNRHFPFLKYMHENQKRHELINENKDDKIIDDDIAKSYYEIITMLLKHLKGFRNYYTHPGHAEFVPDHQLKYMLKDTFEAGIRIVKDRFKITDDKDIEHLRRKIRKNDNLNFKHKFFEDNTSIEKGLAFFICLFLEKKYAFLFLKKLEDFKDSRTIACKATLETYCVNRAILPKQRLESTYSNIGLALDMFNELKRCPKDLFEHLSPADKNRFRVDLDNTTRERIDEDEYNEEILLKRSAERFPWFALNYIDQKGIFENLRFHVDMGRYYYNFYEKHLIDGETTDRSISHHIKAFGKLSELNKLKIEKYGQLVTEISERNKKSDEPYVSDTYPHYHFVENKIGLKETKDGGAILPELTNKTRNSEPDLWLSIYELPALIFYTYLNNNKNATEGVILKYKKRIFQLFSDIKNDSIKSFNSNEDLKVHLASEYNINSKDIPDAVRNYLLCKPENSEQKFKEYAIRKIEKEIELTQRKLIKIKHDIDWVKNDKNKPGKKGWVEIKSGVLADFLATDLLYFQESNDSFGKDKVTGPNFQVLQARLAFYGRDKDMLENIFKQCRLINSDNPHPFLQKVNPNRYNDIVSFYKAYLAQRKAYLNSCLVEGNFSRYYFLKPDGNKWKQKDSTFIEKLMTEYLKKPIYLPRGLFMEAIKTWLLKNGSIHLKEVIRNTEKVNTIYLLQKYFELDRSSDTSQEFYEYKRTYDFINTLYDIRTNKQMFKSKEPLCFSVGELQNKIPELKQKIAELPKQAKEGKSEQEKMQTQYVQFTKNEKLVRHTKATDMLTFLMASNLLKEQMSEELDHHLYRLSDIAPDNEKSILSESIPFSLKIPFFKNNAYGLPDKTNGKLGTKTITQQKLKIKNHGDFIRFAKDRRLNDLLKWIKQEEIERPVLEKELENYDNAKIEAAMLIYRFEEKMHSCYKEYFEGVLSAKPEHKEYISNAEILGKFYAEYPQFKKEEQTISCIRNAFSHNQYPEHHKLPEIIDCNLPHIATTISSLLNEKIGEYTKQLNNK